MHMCMFLSYEHKQLPVQGPIRVSSGVGEQRSWSRMTFLITLGKTLQATGKQFPNRRGLPWRGVTS